MENEKLLNLYPDFDKVYGPYTRSDGRKHIVLNNTNLPKGTTGKMKTISYPKALYEANLGERLKSNETIDHQDRNFVNDDPDNLKVRDRVEHNFLDAKRVSRPESSCVNCGTVFTLSREQCSERSKNKPGPFCSKGCASSHNKKEDKIINDRSKCSYFFLDKT